MPRSRWRTCSPLKLASMSVEVTHTVAHPCIPAATLSVMHATLTLCSWTFTREVLEVIGDMLVRLDEFDLLLIHRTSSRTTWCSFQLTVLAPEAPGKKRH